MGTVIVEIRAAEGGRMRKRSSSNNWGSTRSACSGGGFEITLLHHQPGVAVLRVTGDDAERAFADEAGGHRWQRVPPNDKRGRVQTSTITVAVLPEEDGAFAIDPRDLEWTATRGSGAGGQHRNKTCSAIDLVHRPTGITVHCESERSQHQNLAIAKRLLAARLEERQRSAERTARASDRRAQVGSGMRGDKRRTIRCQEGLVIDHLTNRTWRLADYRRGDW